MWFLQEISWLIFLLYLFRVSAGGVHLNSTYGGREVVGILGSTLNFTWTFIGDMKTADWGIASVGIDGIDTILVSLTTTGPGSALPPSQYAGRVSGTWDGKTSPGLVTFTLDSIRKNDDGAYTCKITPVGLVGVPVFDTLQLVVRELPVISVSSVAATYNEGSPVIISCSATGKPDPYVKWLTENGILKSLGKKSAALTFNSINRTDDGLYTCKANNSAGSTEKKVTLVVHYSPTISSYSPTTTKSWIGQTVKLTCVSDGVPTPTVTWFKPDGNKLRSVIATESTVDVRMARNGDFGDYKCVTDNGVKPADTVTVTVLQITKPRAPSITSSEEDIQATSLTVKWSKPADNGGSPITAYRVALLKNGAEISNQNITDPVKTSVSVGDLDRNTEYDVSVFARNFVFEGPAGNKKVRTKDEGENVSYVISIENPVHFVHINTRGQFSYN